MSSVTSPEFANPLELRLRSAVATQDIVIRALEAKVNGLQIQIADLREAANKRLDEVYRWMHTHPGIKPNDYPGEAPVIRKPRAKRKAKR